MKRLLVATGVLWLASCNCSKPVGPEDGGQPDAGTPCTFDTECPFGEACVDGYCSVPVTPDAGQSCTRHEDCPQGQLCLPSTGQCFTPQDTDAGDEDAGVIPGNCNPGDTQSCGTSKLGECKLGVATCQVINGAYDYGACSGSVEPVAETCNGKDDDCDGLVDDGFPDLTCGTGECRRTVPACLNGAVNVCVTGQVAPEVCDGLDNDCDAFADNMPDIACGVGACRRTAPACVAGAPGTCTQGSPGTETCNGADDNCDGQTDEGLSTVNCGLGICARSVYPCADGGVVACVPGPDAGVEACGNGLDDTCDGRADEGCACTPTTTQTCYSGPNGTSGVGACRTGTQTCQSNGQWGATCAGEVTPSFETCNNADDDCDFQTDELGTSSCGFGVCRRTVQNCIAGVPQTCVQGDAGVEVCNGLDDDCDNTVDNNVANLTCGVGACFRTFPACLGDGGVNNCIAGTPVTEVCNGVDDDCNTFLDDSIPSVACNTGQAGICAAGTTSCNGGLTVCNRTNNPNPTDICGNGLDDNCDGLVDVGPGCCDTSVNRDFDPANQCIDCNDNDGTIYPDAGERCNGKDDNCNGRADEGFDVDNDGFTVCGTIPDGGINPGVAVGLRDCNDNNNFVFPGKTTDCGSTATPATPNGVDDNCNGYVDETCGCNPNTNRDGDPANECLDCNDNNANIYPGRAEVCDGLDNDCNRATVDNCGVSDPCGARSGPSYQPFPTGTDRCRPDLICVSVVSTGALICGSFCNQTTGLGLNDSCQPNEGCYSNLIDSDNQHLCSVRTVGNGATGSACTLDTQCRSTDCMTADGAAGYCTDKCTHEGGCSANTTCHVAEGETTRVGPTQYYYYYSFCRSDSQVAAGGFTLNTGAVCTTANQCKGGADMCLNGRCSEPCCGHADCPSVSGTQYRCGIGPRQRIGYQNAAAEPISSMVPSCLPNPGTRTSGSACAANAECRSGICDRNLSICVDLCCNDTSCTTPGQSCEPIDLRFGDGGVTFMRACVFSPQPTRIEQRP